MMNEARRGEEETLRVEGRGCVFGRQVVFGYPLRNRDAGANQGVHEIGGTPEYKDQPRPLFSPFLERAISALTYLLYSSHETA